MFMLLMVDIEVVDYYQFICLIHILYILLCFVNSPLLLELPPCGQVQVMKACRLMALVSRALMRNGMGILHV